MASDSRLALRAAVVTVVLVWMQAGPVTAQLLGVDRPPTTMTWMMYQTRGMRLCAVEWWQVSPDGVELPIDRYQVHDWDRGDRPRANRLLEGADAVESAGKRLCKRLGADDVRVRARCGSRAGWVPTFSGEQNLCELDP